LSKRGSNQLGNEKSPFPIRFMMWLKEGWVYQKILSLVFLIIPIALGYHLYYKPKVNFVYAYSVEPKFNPFNSRFHL
jgi:hypothetical protein